MVNGEIHHFCLSFYKLKSHLWLFNKQLLETSSIITTSINLLLLFLWFLFTQYCSRLSCIAVCGSLTIVVPLFPNTQQATKVARETTVFFFPFLTKKEQNTTPCHSWLLIEDIIELISIHGIYTFYIWTILHIFTWMDYNSFPFMVFNREPLVDFKYPLLVLLSWFPFMGFIHFTSGLYCIYLHEWIIIPSHSWFLIENH